MLEMLHVTRVANPRQPSWDWVFYFKNGFGWLEMLHQKRGANPRQPKFVEDIIISKHSMPNWDFYFKI